MSYNFVQHRFVWARLLEGRGWIRYSLLVIIKFSLVRSDLYFNPKTDSQVLPLGAIAYAAMSSLPVAQWVGSIPGFRAKPSGAGGGGAHGLWWPDSCYSFLALAFASSSPFTDTLRGVAKQGSLSALSYFQLSSQELEELFLLLLALRACTSPPLGPVSATRSWWGAVFRFSVMIEPLQHIYGDFYNSYTLNLVTNCTALWHHIYHWNLKFKKIYYLTFPDVKFALIS